VSDRGAARLVAAATALVAAVLIAASALPPLWDGVALGPEGEPTPAGPPSAALIAVVAAAAVAGGALAGAFVLALLRPRGP